MKLKKLEKEKVTLKGTRPCIEINVDGTEHITLEDEQLIVAPYTGIDTAAGKSMTGYKAKDLLQIGEAITNGIRDGLKEGISH